MQNGIRLSTYCGIKKKNRIPCLREITGDNKRSKTKGRHQRFPLHNVNQMEEGCHSSVSPADIGTISPNENEKDSGTFHGVLVSLIFEVFLGSP